MNTTSPLCTNDNKNKLHLNLINEKIDLLKAMFFGGFKAYSSFVKMYRPDLFLDTRYQDEITCCIDNIIINIINNNLSKFSSRKLRENLITEALAINDMSRVASIIASAARSVVLNIPKFNHFIAQYYKHNSEDYYIYDIEQNDEIKEKISVIKTAKAEQYQLVLVF